MSGSSCTRSIATRPEPLLLEADDVIAATGFQAPMLDLP